MSIATVTLNPAIDETISLDRLTAGSVHRARFAACNAGGKGINVASCLADWGSSVVATGILGADNAGLFETLFRAKAIEDRFIRLPGSTRTNIKIVDSSCTTDINLPGLAVPAEVLTRLEATVSSLRGIVVLAGSLPDECPPGYYARLAAKLAAAGSRAIVDCSGEALKSVLEGPALPFCIKPNQGELAECARRPLATTEDVVAEIRKLRRRGVSLVVVSMGDKGALFASQEGALIAKLAATQVASTVGAGDAMVAGIAAALEEGAPLERIARLATAFAVAKLGVFGPNLPGRTQVEALAAKVAVTDAA